MMTLSIVLPECSEDFVSEGLRRLTSACVAAMPELDGGYGLGGENGYGVNYENNTFVMRKQWWGDCTCGADDEDGPHRPDCMIMLPNFVHKPTGFTVEWYKWIGRGMDIDANGADFLSVLNDCLASLPAPSTALSEQERG